MDCGCTPPPGTPWVELFSEAGTTPRRPGWPGDPGPCEESRANPESIADHGIDDVVEHYAKIINGLAAKPILIGHSFGGMIAQKLLGQDLAAAAVAIDAAQIKGVLPLPLSALRATLPVFKNPANKHRAVSLTAEQFRYAFGNAIPEEESDAMFERWAIPAPENPDGVCRGVVRIELDGVDITGQDVPIVDDGVAHVVRVVLGG